MVKENTFANEIKERVEDVLDNKLKQERRALRLAAATAHLLPEPAAEQPARVSRELEGAALAIADGACGPVVQVHSIVEEHSLSCRPCVIPGVCVQARTYWKCCFQNASPTGF